MCRIDAGEKVVFSDLNDYSNSFGQIRVQLRNSDGLQLIDYTKSLKPRYGVVYYDIAWGYAALLITIGLAIAAELAGVSRIAIALVGAVLVGYWIAYLQLFLHEGAHWNLARDREVSDRICNTFLGWLAGINVKSYRKVHFQHHRALGTIQDSENSYFFPLNLVFILKGLFGIRALEVILERRHFGAEMKAREDHRKAAIDGPKLDRQLLIGVAMHIGIVTILVSFGLWASAAAWLLGIGVMFPFLGALRQLLEHRSERASPKIDYSRSDHGAVTRIFQDGFFANTFGGAGFNRHLLHHWEPTVSYTRFKELEEFFCDTSLRPIIEQRRTTYGATFMRLFRSSHTISR